LGVPPVLAFPVPGRAHAVPAVPRTQGRGRDPERPGDSGDRPSRLPARLRRPLRHAAIIPCARARAPGADVEPATVGGQRLPFIRHPLCEAHRWLLFMTTAQVRLEAVDVPRRLRA
jgi:hypothetical protein